jgi:WD40 repeat protein
VAELKRCLSSFTWRLSHVNVPLLLGSLGTAAIAVGGTSLGIGGVSLSGAASFTTHVVAGLSSVVLLSAAFFAGVESPPNRVRVRAWSTRTEFRRDRTRDWGEAPTPRRLYGRQRELADLQALVSGSQVVGVFGFGGIGKTTLAVACAHADRDHFDYVFWRSLIDRPPIETVLRECIILLSDQEETDLPGDAATLVTALLAYIGKRRTLIILDNFESILCGDAGKLDYLPGSREYGRLLERIAEQDHRSCLIVTSREKPHGFSVLEGRTGQVQSLTLTGLSTVDGQRLLVDRGLRASDGDHQFLVKTYSGNPLALSLIAATIRRESDSGDMREFTRPAKSAYGDIHDLLEEQFTRLSELEQEVMYWLAVEREAAIADALQNDLVNLSEAGLLRTIGTLRDRSLIESADGAAWTLQPVIMEYVTERLLEQLNGEILAASPRLLRRIALVKTGTKDYLRESQLRVLLEPLEKRLETAIGRRLVEDRCKAILLSLRQERHQECDYTAGNLLNLLTFMQCDLAGFDFSSLQIREPILQGGRLTGLNLSHARLVAPLLADNFGVTLSIAFGAAESATLLAAGMSSGEVRIWKLPNGEPHSRFRAHENWVWSVAFNSDATLLATGGEDGTVRLWETKYRQRMSTLVGHSSRIRSVTFSHDGSLLASGSEDSAIRVWDVASGMCQRVITARSLERIRSVAFSRDGVVLASGGDDGCLCVWETQTGHQIGSLKGHSGILHSVAFSPTGDLIASCGEDRSIRLWDPATGQQVGTVEGHANVVRSIDFSPDGNLLASASEDHTVRVWDIRNRECIANLLGHQNWVRSVAFSPNGDWLASGSEDQSVNVWDVSRRQRLLCLRGQTNFILGLAFNHDGSLIASGGSDNTIYLWAEANQAPRKLMGHSDRVETLSFCQDGSLLASCSGDETVRVWEVQDGNCVNILRGHAGRVWSVAFSRDRSKIASAGDDATIRVWDLGTGQCLHTLGGYKGEVRSVAFSPAGGLLAGGSEDCTVRLWDPETGLPLGVVSGHEERIWSIAFSSDGRLLATGGEDHTIRLWDVKTRRCIRVLATPHQVRFLALSPTEPLVAACGGGPLVTVWHRETGSCVKTLVGHERLVWAVAFDPRGTTLASGGEDGAIRLWDLASGNCIRTVKQDRPYERVRITGVEGITDAQKATLLALGAIEAI